jgi:hypothetical protein
MLLQVVSALLLGIMTKSNKSKKPRKRLLKAFADEKKGKLLKANSKEDLFKQMDKW